MRRRAKLVLASVLLALAGMVLVTPMAEAGWPPFASSKHCRYHLAGAPARSCLSRDVYVWVYPWAKYLKLY